MRLLTAFCSLRFSIPILSLFFLFPGFLPVDVAYAGTLTMIGSGGLEATREGPQIRIKGVYAIENRGDETAKEVFPQFRVGHWAWSGTPRAIDAGKKTEWSVDEVFDESKLQCEETEPCASLQLPLNGAFPLLVLRHYQDLNGYRFSAPDVQRLLIGNLTGEQLDRIQAPALQTTMRTSGDGQKYRGTMETLNLGMKPIRASVSAHTTRELVTASLPPFVDIPPQARTNVEIQWENFSGLEGSGYATFAILQWNDDGVRNFLPTSTVLAIKRVSATPYLLWGSLGAAFVFVGALYAVFRRIRRH